MKKINKSFLVLGNEFFRNGDYAQAIINYEKAISENSDLTSSIGLNLIMARSKLGLINDDLHNTKNNKSIVALNRSAILIHVFYIDTLEIIFDKLLKLQINFDLIITTTPENVDAVTNLAGKNFPKFKLFVYDNLGMDIYPFLRVVKEHLLLNYDYICKLHTKRGDGPQGQAWRDLMFESLIGSGEVFETTLNAFNNNPDLGMVGAAPIFQSAKRLMLDNEQKVNQVFNLAFNETVNSDWGFFCGTMFWIRLELLKPLVDSLDHFKGEFGEKYKKDGLLEHALERVFGYLPNFHGKKIGLLHKHQKGDYRLLNISAPTNNIGNADIRDILVQHESLDKDKKLIDKVGIFDRDFYRSQLPDMANASSLDLVEHYLMCGSFKGLKPNKYFAPIDYRRLHNDVVKARCEPLVHFCRSGAWERRRFHVSQDSEKLNQGFRYRVIDQKIIDWNKSANIARDTNKVSVVIPVFGQPNLVRGCLRSILAAKNKIDYEIILVDNRYDNETSLLIEDYVCNNKNIKSIVNDFNYNFSLGCNVGAVAAEGEVIVFLNSDTEVFDGWLDNMREPLADKKIVAVQPKLIYPDNTVQCIGMVASKWSSLPFQLYNGESFHAPHVNYARNFNVVSAACMAVRASDFIDVMGFDPIYVNGWEDVDFCLKLTTRRNAKCLYLPSVVVVHHESKSSGRGAYLEVNRKNFIDVWCGKVPEDALSHFESDKIAVNSWRPDNYEFVARGIAMYFPVLGDVDSLSLVTPFLIQDKESTSYKKNQSDVLIVGKQKKNNVKPTVLLVAHASATELFGSERSFLDILDALHASGVNIVVSLPNMASNDYLSCLLNKVVCLYVFHYTHWTSTKDFSNAVINRFERLFTLSDIDFVYANTIMNGEVTLACSKFKLPLITHVREMISDDIDLAKYIGLDPAVIIGRVKESSDFIVSNSRATLDMFGGTEKALMARNVVRTEDFDSINIVNPSRIVFGLISSNIPKKGLKCFFEVAKKCESIVPNVIFVLVGPVNSFVKQYLSNYVNEPFKNVLISGYIDTSSEAMSSVNVVLSLSNFSESFGRTIAEGFAAARPAIAYSRGAISELVIDGETGILVEPGDIDGVVAAVKEFSTDLKKIREYGLNGLRLVNELCNPLQLQSSIIDSLIYSYISNNSSNEESFFRLKSSASIWIGKCSDAEKVRVLDSLVFKKTTVVIPVYNAFEEFVNCFTSIKNKRNKSVFDIVVVNDCSTDPRVMNFLNQEILVSDGFLKVINNDVNLGYTKSINKAINSCPNSDVILLNSDTVVTIDWILSIRLSAYSCANTATVTAMSNNAGVFSFPNSGGNNALKTGCNHDQHAVSVLNESCKFPNIELPTGNGFCMFISREVISKIGVFDDVGFPRGYGEENDFCMRAKSAGFVNILSTSTFIYHIKSASFKDEREELIKNGLSVLKNKHPSYAEEVSNAFGSESMANLRRAIAEAIRD